MPRLWTDTIETHRREVRTAILETTASLVAEHGIRGVTMAQIAEETGIGRATLYKYFTDVEAILDAWHQLHVERYLAELERVREASDDPHEQLLRVLERYALIQHERRAHHATELVAHLHPGHAAQPEAERRLHSLLHGVLQDAVRARRIRTDVGIDELVHFCVRSLAAAADVASKPAVHRLVSVVTDGLHAS